MSNKKKILVVYPDMGIGGSSTSLLSFLNCLDEKKYEIDLQLYKRQGVLLCDIPPKINVLPQAFKYDGKFGKTIKILKLLFSPYLIKIQYSNKKYKKDCVPQIMADFQVKHLSYNNKKKYDIAIGFLEGWSDRYLAYNVEAKRKIGWYHGTIANVAPVFALEYNWLKKVDKVAFVAKDCENDFNSIMPEFKDKTITVENIHDSNTVRTRAMRIISGDEVLKKFTESKCFKIVTVCRIDINVKGLDRVIACAKKLKTDHENYIWCIVGGGTEYNNLKKLIENNELEDRVFLAGMQNNPYPYVKVADLFCLASRFEGKPMTVVESMMLGVPVLTTKYLAASDQIIQDKEGWIVNNDDSAIYYKLKEIIKHRELIANCKDYINNKEYGNTEYMRHIEATILD